MFESLLIFGASGSTSGEARDYSDNPISFANIVAAAGELPQTALDIIMSDDQCPIAFDVRSVFPNWIVEDHENGNTNIVKFFQTYYNWLYCSDRSSLYTDSFVDLQDIDNMNSVTIGGFNSSFIPQIDFGRNVSALQGFLKNFRRDIIEKKGTAEGVALFFTKAFPNVRTVKVSGSNLNIQIEIFDNGNISFDLYDSAYKDFMHIAGTTYTLSLNPSSGSQFTEQQDDDEIDQRLAGSTGFGGGTASAYEVPIIGNYYVYNMGDTGTIDSSSGCSGSVHARAIAGNTSDLPTFTHPNSAIASVGASFGSINIYEFLYMDYDSSSNKSITPC